MPARTPPPTHDSPIRAAIASAIASAEAPFPLFDSSGELASADAFAQRYREPSRDIFAASTGTLVGYPYKVPLERADGLFRDALAFLNDQKGKRGARERIREWKVAWDRWETLRKPVAWHGRLALADEADRLLRSLKSPPQLQDLDAATAMLTAIVPTLAASRALFKLAFDTTLEANSRADPSEPWREFAHCDDEQPQMAHLDDRARIAGHPLLLEFLGIDVTTEVEMLGDMLDPVATALAKWGGASARGKQSQEERDAERELDEAKKKFNLKCDELEASFPGSSAADIAADAIDVLKLRSPRKTELRTGAGRVPRTESGSDETPLMSVETGLRWRREWRKRHK